MLKPRNLLTSLALWLTTASLMAQGEFVQLESGKAHPTRVIAKFANRGAMSQGLALANQMGLRVHRTFANMPGLVVFDDVGAPRVTILRTTNPQGRAQVLAQRLQTLRSSGVFEFVQADRIVSIALEATDEAFTDGRLWALRNEGQEGGTLGADIDAVRAWDITTGSSEVIVAVVDTGILYTHKDLAAQMWRNPLEIPGNGVDDDNNGIVDDVFGINAPASTGDPYDDHSHGTHVAGTIGAAANDGNPVVGVAWKVRLMACKFLTAEGFGTDSDAITCIDYAISNGARVMNNSWGGLGFDPALQEAINRARSRGVLFVAAAGNNGSDNDTLPFYPASYPLDNIISVAATDRNDLLASFSCFGATTVHLGAPGVAIYSCINRDDGAYEAKDGTSMAAPHVSGVAALLLSAFPQASFLDVRDAILGGVVPIPSLTGRTTTGGRLSAFRPLSAFATPDGILDISVQPASGSVLIGPGDQVVEIKVKDGFPVTNAIVLVKPLGARDPIQFQDDGLPPDAAEGDAVYTGSIPLPQGPAELSLQVAVTAPEKEPAALTVRYSIIKPPENDMFAAATKIDGAGGTIASNNQPATMEPGEPAHDGVATSSASLWWKWSPTTDTNVFLDTTGSGFPAVLAVYTGTKLSALKPVAGAHDPYLASPAYLEFEASAGATYYIAVASPDPSLVGSTYLRLTPGGGLDVKAPSVTVITPPSGLVVLTNRVTVSGTAFDPQPDSSRLSEVLLKLAGGLGISASGTTNWTASLRLVPGVNRIEVRAYDHAGNISQPKILSVDYRIIDPANDLYANATPLPGTKATNQVDTTKATKEPGEPNHVGNEGGKSVWYSFEAPQDGALSLTTLGSDFDTLLALYTGSRVYSLNALRANDDAVAGGGYSSLVQAVKGGETYHIVVDGYGGDGGKSVLISSFAHTNVYWVDISAPEGGSVSTIPGYYPANAEITLQAVPAPGYTFDNWLFDGMTSLANPLTIPVKSAFTVVATFRPEFLSDGFESGGLATLPWVGGGVAPWIIQSESAQQGQFSARSGIIADGQESVLTITAAMRAGNSTFWVKLSSEEGWDWLELWLNGEKAQQWSGNVDWQMVSLPVPQGLNTLTWRYAKDRANKGGLDAAFLDSVFLPLSAEVDETTSRARLEVEPLYNRGLRIIVHGQAYQTYAIQESTDLLKWRTVLTATAYAGELSYTDPAGTRLTRKYFRAIVP